VEFPTISPCFSKFTHCQ